jgi:hypothetical protein
VVPDLGGVVEHAGLAGVTGHGGDGVFEALVLELAAGHQVVEVGDVGVVVLAVVELERLARDVGLERVEYAAGDAAALLELASGDEATLAALRELLLVPSG